MPLYELLWSLHMVGRILGIFYTQLFVIACNGDSRVGSVQHLLSPG